MTVELSFVQEQACLAVERICTADPGGRGIAPLIIPGSYAKAAGALASIQSVAIVSGFYIPSANSPENDGPAGALMLAWALRALGKQVTLVTDKHCVTSLNNMARSAKLGEKDPWCWVTDCPENVDALVSIERVGRNQSGDYCNMRGQSIAEFTDPLDELFLRKQANQITIGIGDGGNEIGMGNVADRVRQHIKNGEKIACVVPVDHLLVASVSNWGAAGLVACLSILTRRKLLLSDRDWRTVNSANVSALLVDGVLKIPSSTVDGLSNDQTVSLHLQLTKVAHGFL